MPRRRLFKTDSWEYGHDSRAQEQPLPEPGKRRAATTFVYAALFFAGATFTAVAGDRFAQMTAQEDAAATASDSTSTDTTTTLAAPDASLLAPAPAADSAPAPADSGAPADSTAPADPAAASDPGSADSQDALIPLRSSSSADWQPGDTSAAPSVAPTAKPRSNKATRGSDSHWKQVLLLPVSRPAPKPEIEGPAAAATIWLNRALPDPTPPALRLSPKFARHLKAASKGAGINWALLLGVLRAKGVTGHNPTDAATLRRLAGRIAAFRKTTGGGEWATALAYGNRAGFADKALALARYDRAVGLNALVHGLESSKTSLERRLLDDPAISIYPGGRDDIAKDKVDVRVLALISYLRESFGQVTVSSLISGHRLYARPGVVSAHVYGHAVDVSGLGGTPILGHQAPGGLTEQAVHDILLLPAEVMPKQVISLLGLGGPSFPLADHYNHIHIGY